MKIETYDEKGRSIVGMLPAYAGLLGDKSIIAISQEGAYVIKRSVEIARYQRAPPQGYAATFTQGPRHVEDYSGPYRFVRDQINLFKLLPEADDLGRIRPSQYAIEAATQSVFKILEAFDGLPLPSDVSTDRDGAFRIVWENGPRSLELVCQFEEGQRPYIYFSDESEYRITHDFSSQRLARLFGWLKGRASVFPQ
jgi:hypothetical protein